MNRKQQRCQPYLIAAAAAVAAGVIGAGIFYLVNRQRNAELGAESAPASAIVADASEEAKAGDAPPGDVASGDIPAGNVTAEVKKTGLSREELLEVANDIIEVQKKLAFLMMETIDQIVDKKLNGIVEVYKYLEDNPVEDPVAKHGLTIAEFDNLISDYSNDPVVNDKIIAIMKGPGIADPDATRNATSLDIPKICELVRIMLSVMEDFAKQLKAWEKVMGSEYNGHIASLAAQASLGAYLRTEKRTAAETVEKAILLNQADLTDNTEFLNSYSCLQRLIADIDGSGQQSF